MADKKKVHYVWRREENRFTKWYLKDWTETWAIMKREKGGEECREGKMVRGQRKKDDQAGSKTIVLGDGKIQYIVPDTGEVKDAYLIPRTPSEILESTDDVTPQEAEEVEGLAFDEISGKVRVGFLIEEKDVGKGKNGSRDNKIFVSKHKPHDDTVKGRKWVSLGDWNDNAAKMRRRKVDKSEKRKSEKKGDPGCDGSEKDKLYYCRTERVPVDSLQYDLPTVEIDSMKAEWIPYLVYFLVLTLLFTQLVNLIQPFIENVLDAMWKEERHVDPFVFSAHRLQSTLYRVTKGVEYHNCSSPDVFLDKYACETHNLYVVWVITEFLARKHMLEWRLEQGHVDFKSKQREYLRNITEAFEPNNSMDDDIFALDSSIITGMSELMLGADLKGKVCLDYSKIEDPISFMKFTEIVKTHSNKLWFSSLQRDLKDNFIRGSKHLDGATTSPRIKKIQNILVDLIISLQDRKTFYYNMEKL
eukprot:jgi/Bigna1/77551/fgenesh1_pg.48_\